MPPFQIVRAIQDYFARRQVFAREEIYRVLSALLLTLHFSEVAFHSESGQTVSEVTVSMRALKYNGQGLGDQFEFPPRDAAQFEKSNQRLFDQIIRARGTGSNSDDRRAIR